MPRKLEADVANTETTEEQTRTGTGVEPATSGTTESGSRWRNDDRKEPRDRFRRTSRRPVGDRRSRSRRHTFAGDVEFLVGVEPVVGSDRRRATPTGIDDIFDRSIVSTHIHSILYL
jgi:hypothetical protein